MGDLGSVSSKRTFSIKPTFEDQGTLWKSGWSGTIRATLNICYCKRWKFLRLWGTSRDQGLLDTVTLVHRGFTETVEAFPEPAQICTRQGSRGERSGKNTFLHYRPEAISNWKRIASEKRITFSKVVIFAASVTHVIGSIFFLFCFAFTFTLQKHSNFWFVLLCISFLSVRACMSLHLYAFLLIFVDYFIWLFCYNSISTLFVSYLILLHFIYYSLGTCFLSNKRQEGYESDVREGERGWKE